MKGESHLPVKGPLLLADPESSLSSDMKKTAALALLWPPPRPSRRRLSPRAPGASPLSGSARADPPGGREGARDLGRVGSGIRLSAPGRAAGARRSHRSRAHPAGARSRPREGALPENPRSVQMSAEADRRAVLQTIASVGALSALAPAAFADGAVSAATVARARGIYGARRRPRSRSAAAPRLLPSEPTARTARARGGARAGLSRLSSAARARSRRVRRRGDHGGDEKGDLGALRGRARRFDLIFASSRLCAAIDEKKAVKAGVASIYAAVKAGDKAALKTSYDARDEVVRARRHQRPVRGAQSNGARAPAVERALRLGERPARAFGPRATAQALSRARGARVLSPLCAAQASRRAQGYFLTTTGRRAPPRASSTRARSGPLEPTRARRGGCRRTALSGAEREGRATALCRFGTRGGRAGVAVPGLSGTGRMRRRRSPRGRRRSPETRSPASAAVGRRRSQEAQKTWAKPPPPTRGSRARAVKKSR